MLIVLSDKFYTQRPNVKQGIVNLIQSTIDNIISNGDVFDTDISKLDVKVVIDDGKVNWSDLKDHKVAIRCITKEVDGKIKKPAYQYSYNVERGLYEIECFSPAKVVTWAEGYPEFYMAFVKGVNFEYFKSLAEKAKDINYTVVTDVNDPVFQQVLNNPGLLGCDIETRGFSWKHDDILVHGFSYEDNQVMIIPQWALDQDAEFLKAFVQLVTKDHTLVWQNGKFDAKFYRYRGWDVNMNEDIMLQSYALDERGGIHGLEVQAAKILNTPEYKHKIDFATVSPDSEDLHYYLAQDCIYTRLLHKHYNKVMSIKEHEHSYRLYKNILLKANYALIRLEENGFYVRRKHTQELEESYRVALEKAENTLIELAYSVGFTPEKFVIATGQKSLPETFKCGSPKQLGYVLMNLLQLPPHKGRTSTDEAAMLYWLFDILDFPIKDAYALETVEDDVIEEWYSKSTSELNKSARMFLWNILKFRKLKKMYSTYIANTLLYSQDDGRVHVTYKIHGTVTGRLSSGDPMNLQNIPRKKDIKCMFGAPKGKTLIECDYSQAELRVLAFLSQDPDMIKTYVDGGDLHDAVATKMFGPNFTKEQRVGAKTVNFGLAYGRGKSSVAEQLRCSYQFASDLVDQWHASMPVASKFITETRAKPKQGLKCTTPLGRERRFWLINHHNENTVENESINFPIQSTASDCCLIALHHFIQLIERDPVKFEGVMPVNIVHDAILVEAPDEKVDLVVGELTRLMTEVPKELIPELNVPMVADAEVTKLGWGKKTSWEPGIVKKLLEEGKHD